MNQFDRDGDGVIEAHEIEAAISDELDRTNTLRKEVTEDSMRQRASHYGHGIPEWSPYRMGVSDEELKATVRTLSHIATL